MENNASPVMKAVTNAQRAQELRKFFAPYDPTCEGGETGNLNQRLYDDGVLQSIAESLMWKLGASRAIVSLVDRNTQYFLAGSIREEHETESQSRFWFGQSSANLAEGFCSNTLKVEDGEPAFVVNDLSHDVRFKSLAIVDGSIASLRFYAGLPILTDRGITIGSLYVVDDRPRSNGLSSQQEKFLSTSAYRVMQYLEVAREAATRPRLSMMSRGIAIFLERKAEIGQYLTASRVAREASDRTLVELELYNSISAPLTNHADEVKRTFELAAELLKASFNIDNGGVAFFDTVQGFDDRVTTSRKTGWTNDSNHRPSITSLKGMMTGNLVKDNITKPERQTSSTSTFTTSKQSRPRTKLDLLRPSKVIAKYHDQECHPEELDIETMESLINRYPDGTVWYFDDDGFFSSSLEQEEVVGNFPTVALAVETLAKEANIMSKKFPGTRQLIFLPLWDFVAKRWCASCFIWSHNSFPVFTVDCEVVHLSAFTNSVMSEISRLDAIVANQIKGEFIGSMSHEFRSPLHGILASAEFLNDTDHSRSQSMLISTIHNCGRTLLDTVNHLLDYSRLNSLNKELTGNIDTSDEFNPNPLYCITNIAVLCEEVIDGMIMSSGFEDITEPDLQSVTAHTHPDTLPSRIEQIGLPVMLDMENTNWSFFTQPGAMRRILMNIFGNSIKYTKSGFIRVTLASEKVPPLNTLASNDFKYKDTVMKLTIRDSGCGMSADFLEKSLYTPFIQENILAPGVGLGLSITRNIVDQLGGTIEVRSQVGKGTSVEVRLPLEAESPTSALPAQVDMDDEYFGAASQIALEKTIALRRSPGSIANSVLGTTDVERNPTTSELAAQYLVDWLGFRVIIFDHWTPDMRSDVVIVEEQTESESYQDLLGLPGMPPILVICTLASCVEKGRTELPEGVAGFVSIPIGPRKLAKVLLQHFESVASSSPAASETITRTFLPNLQAKGSTINTHNMGLNSTFESAARAKVGALELVGLRSRSAPIIPGLENKIVPPRTSDIQIDTSTPITKIPPPPATSNPISNCATRPTFLSAATTSPTTTLKSPLLHKQDAQSNSARTPLKVLAVDDNEINLALLRRYLDKRSQDSVDYARNGLEAFEKVKAAALFSQKGYDVIFMDLNMPVLNGFESSRRIRDFETASVSGVVSSFEAAVDNKTASHDFGMDGLTLPPGSGAVEEYFGGGGDDGLVANPKGERTGKRRASRSYIIALTGLSAERDREEAVACGIDAFLTKPVRFKNVGKLLEERCWVKAGRGCADV